MPSHLVVAAYHDVPHRDTFAEHLDYYADRFSVIDLDSVITALATAEALPDHSLVITFDDGDRSIFDVALPLLRERQMPAVAFVVAELIDTQMPFWWNEVHELVSAGAEFAVGPTGQPAEAVRALKQVPNAQRLAMLSSLRASTTHGDIHNQQLTSDEVRELAAAGVEIGNHTATHPLLDQCTDAEVLTEVTVAHRRLSEILGHPPRAFAYPNGNVDKRVPGILRELDYEIGFAFDHRWASLPSTDPLAVSRVRVDATAPLPEVRAITSAVHPLIHSLRQRVVGGTS